ncbi:unnamed protein product [Diplocarpon coronariae]|uniref:D-cysteine desulfhydrase n=1 Tax=Diplocarpon coronariae TaxID=2795749 RepID=A0A218ZBE1_9HELO|nr:D-cysteine desulfhydrase [Marssonina coronariae]
MPREGQKARRLILGSKRVPTNTANYPEKLSVGLNQIEGSWVRPSPKALPLSPIMRHQLVYAQTDLNGESYEARDNLIVAVHCSRQNVEDFRTRKSNSTPNPTGSPFSHVN